MIMKSTTRAMVAILIVLLVGFGARLWQRTAASRNEVTRAHPGVAWRVAGGIGATPSANPTVAGVAVPTWFGQRGAPLRRIAGRVTFGGEPVADATVELGSELTDSGLLPRPTRRTGADGRFDFGTQPPARFTVAASASTRSIANPATTPDRSTGSDR